MKWSILFLFIVLIPAAQAAITQTYYPENQTTFIKNNAITLATLQTMDIEQTIITNNETLNFTPYLNYTKTGDGFKWSWELFQGNNNLTSINISGVPATGTAGQSYIIYINATKNAEVGNTAIQLFPSLYGFQLKNHTWWNTSYGYANFVTLGNGTRPVMASVNWSNTTGTSNTTVWFSGGNCARENCSERVYLADNNTIIPYKSLYNESEEKGTSFGQDILNITVNATAYSVFYNNSIGNNYDNGNATFNQLYDPFGSLNAARWTLPGASVINGILSLSIGTQTGRSVNSFSRPLTMLSRVHLVASTNTSTDHDFGFYLSASQYFYTLSQSANPNSFRYYNGAQQAALTNINYNSSWGIVNITWTQDSKAHWAQNGTTSQNSPVTLSSASALPVFFYVGAGTPTLVDWLGIHNLTGAPAWGTWGTSVQPPSSSPNITSWGNNQTNNNSLNITVEKGNVSFFNATGDQAINFTFFGAVNIQGNGTTNGNATQYYSNVGTYFVNLTCSNANGACLNTVNWTINVVDSIPPLSITNNATSTYYHGVNNTWMNPTTADFDHVWLRFANGSTYATNISVPLFWKNASWTPHYTQNISAQTVDTTGNINQTKIWFNVTIPNAPITITNTTNPPSSPKLIDEGNGFFIDFNAVDDDYSDPQIFWTNRSDLIPDFDITTGKGNVTTNYSNAGTHSVGVGVSDKNGSVSNFTMVIIVNNMPFIISAFTPATPFSIDQGAQQIFTADFNLSGGGMWFINGTQVQSNSSVMTANYTNTSAVVGYWNVSLIANNSFDTVIQTWLWTVRNNTPTTPAMIATATISPFYINWSWNSTANTNDYDVWINGADLGADITNPFYNASYSAHVSVDISVRSHNHTVNLYSPWLNNTAAVQNNPLTQLAIGNRNVNEGLWLNFTDHSIDDDAGSMVYGTNCTIGTFNSTTGNFNYSAGYGDVGSYTCYFNSSDGYGSTGNETITITVNNVPLTISLLPASDFTTGYPVGQVFTSTTNRAADYHWYINGTLVQTNLSVASAAYPNISSVGGYWNVTLVVNDSFETNSTMRNWTVSNNTNLVNFTFTGASISESQIYQSSQSTHIQVDVNDSDGYITSVLVGITFLGVEFNSSMSGGNDTWSYDFKSGVPGSYSISRFYATDNAGGTNSTATTLSFVVVPVAAGGVPGGGSPPTPTPQATTPPPTPKPAATIPSPTSTPEPPLDMLKGKMSSILPQNIAQAASGTEALKETVVYVDQQPKERKASAAIIILLCWLYYPKNKKKSR